MPDTKYGKYFVKEPLGKEGFFPRIIANGARDFNGAEAVTSGGHDQLTQIDAFVNFHQFVNQSRHRVDRVQFRPAIVELVDLLPIHPIEYGNAWIS